MFEKYLSKPVNYLVITFILLSGLFPLITFIINKYMDRLFKNPKATLWTLLGIYFFLLYYIPYRLCYKKCKGNYKQKILLSIPVVIIVSCLILSGSYIILDLIFPPKPGIPVPVNLFYLGIILLVLLLIFLYKYFRWLYS